jgi:hypothetical protein
MGGSAVDRAGAFAEGARVAAGESGADLGEDAEGDFGGCLGAEVKAYGGVETGELGGSGRKAVAGEVFEDAVGAFFGSEETEVAELKGEQVAENGDVVDIVVCHHYGEGAGLGGDVSDEIFGGRDEDAGGGGKAGGGGEGGARIGDGDGPAEGLGELGEGLSVVAGSKNEEGWRRGDRFLKDRDAGGWRRQFSGEAGAEGYVGVGTLPNDGKCGWPTCGEIGGECGNPRGFGSNRFEQHMDDTVAPKADAPNKVVFRRRVVGDELGLAGGSDALGADEHIFL